jgi:hypothetical protein
MGEGHERGYIYNGGLQVHKDGEMMLSSRAPRTRATGSPRSHATLFVAATGRADDGYAPFMPDLIPKLPALDEHCTVMCQDRFRELIFDADEDANGEVNLTADKRAALMAELLSNLSDPGLYKSCTLNLKPLLFVFAFKLASLSLSRMQTDALTREQPSTRSNLRWTTVTTKRRSGSRTAKTSTCA